MTDDKLAAPLKAFEDEWYRLDGVTEPERHRRALQAALAVYAERWSHTQTVNIDRAEWEGLLRAMRGARSQAGKVDEEGCRNAFRILNEALERTQAHTSTNDAEPSDAEVGAAMNAAITYYEEQGYTMQPESVDFQAMRSALRAVATARGGSDE